MKPFTTRHSFPRLLSLLLIFCFSCFLFSIPTETASAKPKFKRVYRLEDPYTYNSSITVLNGHQVLFMNGSRGELYDFKNNKLTPVPPLNITFLMPNPLSTFTPISETKSLFIGSPSCTNENKKTCWKIRGAYYDAEKNEFELIRKYFLNRKGHTATLLKNRKILIIGGIRSTYDYRNGLITEKEVLLLDPWTLESKIVGHIRHNRTFHKTV